jgi:hypothetical protein
VSVAEIIQELPKLNAEERSAVAQKLRELAVEEELLFLNGAADTMFHEMDNQEQVDLALV